MRIDGKQIADTILASLKNTGAKPALAIIQIGDDPASSAYIRQKQKAAEQIGVKIILSNNLTDVDSYNIDKNIHGIIIQRPVPGNLDIPKVTVKKDVDGFLPNSPFEVPVALAVGEILKNVHITEKNIVIIGRGETAGKPIAAYFQKQNCTTSVISSQTPNPEKILRNADIIISCVGKEKIITSSNIKPGVILISVGIWRDDLGKLHGDYEEDDIKNIASFYTPTPGGVGPINVACLMQNVVKAAQNTH